MKRRFLVTLIAVAIVIALPIATCYAAVTSPGTFYQDMYSGVPGASWQSANGYIKYNYDSDALLSRYYYTAGGNTWFAFPISAPVNAGGGETENVGGYELGRAAAMGGGDLNSAIPAYGVTIAFRTTCDGLVTGYGVCNANYSTLFDAYATILKYGYGGIENKAASFGIGTSDPDQAAQYYATNMAMQRISGQAMSHSDIGGFTSAHVKDLRVSNYEYFLEDTAKRILCSNQVIFPNLQGSWGAPSRLNSTTVSIPLNANVPAGENPGYYSNATGFYWTNLGNLSVPNYSAVATAMSNFNGATSVTSSLQISSASIKGGETLSFALAGKVADQQYYTRIFATYGPHVQSFIIGDPSSANNTTNIRNLDTVVVSTTLPLFDVQTTGITCNASYNAGDTGTVSVTYKNNSSLPAVNVPVSLSCSSPLGTPFTVTNPNQTISELLAGVSTTVNYTVKANTLSGNATATFTAKIGYNTDGSTRFNEANYTNNTLTKTATVNSIPDFSCTFPVSDYIAGQDAVFAVTVNNGGVIGNPNVPVRLTVGSTSYDTTIPVPVGSNLAVFRVTMPNVTGNVNVTAVVDPNNTIPELNETNNSTTHTATVTQLHAPQQVDSLDSSLETTYLNKNKTLPDAPNNPDSITHTWQEYRYENGNYVLHTYTASLSVTFTVRPDSRVASGNTVQSGFGIEQAATAAITTNYDHPEKLVGIQDVWLTYPETYYGLDSSHYAGYYEPMTSSSMGVLSNAWSYLNNPYSVKNMPLHYIPLWYPDGKYTVLCTMFGAWSPDGKMYADVPGSVTVSGNMYDRITAVGH